MLAFLVGKKTYLCAAVIGVAEAAKYMGYISGAEAGMIETLAGAGGLAALRAAVTRLAGGK